MTRLSLPHELGALFFAPAGTAPLAQHEAAHALLAESLARYAGIAPPPAIARRDNGKPWFPAYPDLHFNLSHCAGAALCLLSPYECGADAEYPRPVKPRVLERVFTPKEQRLILQSENPSLLFTRLWTMKEACVKALGTGIAYPMREIEITAKGDTLSCQRENTRFWHTVLSDGCCVSVCCLLSHTPAPCRYP